tara:strand:- start:503 stop:979 length:477 start_codon:yes stop_codon:yes gene_type:complete
MAIEIERRFLIKNNNWRQFIIHKSDLIQGYITSLSDDWIIRIRKDKREYKLTLKKHIINSSSLEFEYNIPQTDGKQLMSNVKYKINKERFYLKINQKDWIIDCFKDKNFPLEIAEIEISHKKEVIVLPDFLSSEITGIKKFSNFELSRLPYSFWKQES